MESIKKIILVACFCIMFLHIKGQSVAVIQSAFSKSYVAEQEGNYSAAINELKSIYDANSYIINIRLGWLNYQAKQYAESINYYEKAIALKPYAIEARFGCVKPLSVTENWEKAKANYLQILKIDPQNTTACYWLGFIYYNRKEYGNAEKLFEKIVNLYPLDYDSSIMLAWSKLNSGKSADARVLFNHVLTIKPGDSSAMSGLKLMP
jgi:tetratricopeptide (TPR) repeat protein